MPKRTFLPSKYMKENKDFIFVFAFNVHMNQHVQIP